MGRKDRNDHGNADDHNTFRDEPGQRVLRNMQ